MPFRLTGRSNFFSILELKAEFGWVLYREASGWGSISRDEGACCSDELTELPNFAEMVPISALMETTKALVSPLRRLTPPRIPASLDRKITWVSRIGCHTLWRRLWCTRFKSSVGVLLAYCWRCRLPVSGSECVERS